MKNVIKWLFILISLSLCGLVVYGLVTLKDYLSVTDEGPKTILLPDIADVNYCTPDGVSLKLDLYLPSDTPPPWQVLVYVHGGSFTAGDKRKGSGIIDIPAMTSRGFAVASINDRLMPEYPFPAEILDAKCAIRFLRSHAEEYQLKTEKIGIWGGSAGGHLSSMMGLTNGEAIFESGENLDQSSRVDAVVEMFGPTDLTAGFNWMQRLLLRRAFGTDDPLAPLLSEASPVNYITGDEPPFLILHGEQDDAVPLEQARVFHQKLVDAGVQVTLVTVTNANHNFKPTGGPITPTREEISSQMADFFDLWLR